MSRSRCRPNLLSENDAAHTPRRWGMSLPTVSGLVPVTTLRRVGAGPGTRF